MTGKFITTVEENGRPVRQADRRSALPDEREQELHLVNLYPRVKYQPVLGFGGAITEAVGLVLAALPPERARQVLEAYYGPSGIGYSLARVPLDSCDFSAGPYCAIEEGDEQLTTFSLRRDEKTILPCIRQAEALAGKKLSVMLSPWSPPAFMKTNGSRMDGGQLREEYAGLWARYICRYILEYKKRGVQVDRLSVQNEPNAAQAWDSCRYSACQERNFLRDHLHPALVRSGLGDTQVFIWDHNKERVFERAARCIGPDTDGMIAGVAFHWYSGDHFEGVRLVREHFPDKLLLFSEGCIEYSRFDRSRAFQNAQMYAHDMIGNFNAGMNLFLDWNIALDQNGGPNHAGNYCEAPVLCDTACGRIEYRPSFYYIAHFSHHIRPGARRIAVTCYSERVETTAFENPDGSIAVVLLNRTDQALPVTLRLEGQLLDAPCPPRSITTAVLER